MKNSPDDASIPAESERGVSDPHAIVRKMRRALRELAAMVDDFEESIGVTPTRSPERAESIPAPAAPRSAPKTAPAEPIDSSKPFNPLESLKNSIGGIGTRYVHPDQRNDSIWAMLAGVPDSQLTGEPRWTLPIDPESDFYAQLDPESPVLTLDRNASYFSACGNVRVATDVPYRTGPMTLDRANRTGGFYRVQPFAWPWRMLPHPLGRIADRPSDQWWITAPHLQLLRTIARKGMIGEPVILDSFAGPAHDGLFKAFAADVAAHRDPHSKGYTDLKRKQSIALRNLWAGDDINSPFWRPDWSIAIRAEAAVRHWAKAWRATGLTDEPDAANLGAGPILLSLSTVDEVTWVMPANALGLPNGYVGGDAFGEVKVKAGISLMDWLTDQHTPSKRKAGRRG